MALSLPEELLVQILSQPSIVPRKESDEDEEPSQGQYTLYNASLVSKTFQRLSQPLLYKSIDARNVVDTVCFVCIDYRRREGTEWNAFAERAKKILQHANLSHETVELLQGALSPPTGSKDIGLAMLMVMCPNLQAWEFQVHDTYPLTERVFYDVVYNPDALISGRPAPSSRPLQSLRELTVTNIQDEGSAKLGVVRPYVTFPSLRMLRCIQFTLAAELVHLMSPADRVELDKVDIETNRVHELFNLFPNLSDLRLRWGDDLVCNSGACFDEIGRRLRESGANLRKLYLNAEENFWTRDAGMLLPPLGSLRELKSLTDLSLQAVMLTGRHAKPEVGQTVQGEPLTAVLPFSLHVLEINNFDLWGEDDPEVYPDYFERWIDENVTELMSDQQYAELHIVSMINRKTSADALLADASRLGWAAETGVDIERLAEEGYEARKEWLELRRLSSS